jgi:3-methylfumaryl-CoA hydratase
VNSTSLKDWLGNNRRDDDEVELGAVRRLAATLDQDPATYRRGSEVPESWYALLFGTFAQQHTLGPDGHPDNRHLLPPFPGTRRMFAGRRTRFHRPLRVGEAVSRLSTVTRAEPKSGRSGAFTLLTLLHEISGPSGLAVTEEQDVVYRAAVAPGSTEPPRASAPAVETPDWSRPFVVDPVLLFRYSALTFNAHRIHYDLDYVRRVEGYPGLIVNGGLTALLLVETARPHLPGRIAGYAARAVSPLCAGEAVAFNGRLTAEGTFLWATGPDDGLAYRVDVTLEGRQENGNREARP